MRSRRRLSLTLLPDGLDNATITQNEPGADLGTTPMGLVMTPGHWSGENGPNIKPCWTW